MPQKTKKSIPYLFWFVITAVVYISLDTKIVLPYRTILRWAFPAFLLLLSAVSGSHFRILLPGTSFLIMLFYFGLTVFRSPIPWYSFERLISLALIVCMYCTYFSRLAELGKIDDIIRPWAALFIIYGLINLIFAGNMVSGRVAGITGNPNSLGLEAAVSTAFATMFYERAKQRGRILWGAYMIVEALLSLMSGSRTAAFLIVLIAVYFFTFIHQKRAVAIAFPVIFLLLLLIPNDIAEKFPVLGRINELGIDRGELWAYAVSVFRQKPLFGWGYGAANTTTNIHVSEGLGYHSSYLVILVETGVVGLLLILAVIIPALVKGYLFWKKNRSADLRLMILMAIIMLLDFYGESAMTSVGSTEGFFFWGVLIWIICRTKYDKCLPNTAEEMS